jgi:dihydropteroate synthase
MGIAPHDRPTLQTKGRFHLVKVGGVPSSTARLLRKVMHDRGGEVVLSKDSLLDGESVTDLLIMATEQALSNMTKIVRDQRFPHTEIAKEIELALSRLSGPQFRSCRIGQRVFAWGKRTYVMGILNVTPDSFSGDGLLQDGETSTDQAIDRIIAQASLFLADGADIIDIGGESTRPGAATIDAEEEISRVVPVIRRLRQITEVPISIDTYKAAVASAALDAGADFVNDVWGLQMDPALGPVIAERGVPVVLTHNRSKPKDAKLQARLGGHYIRATYGNLMADIVRELRERIDYAVEMGIGPEKIIIDPGIGFGKTVEQNLWLVNRVDELRALGFPILLGPSRKSFIGYTLDLAPEERLEGTAAAVTVGIVRGGADIVRVHDVKFIVRLVRMTDALVRAS